MMLPSVLNLTKVEVQVDLELLCNESTDKNFGINNPNWHAVKATVSRGRIRAGVLGSLILIETPEVLIGAERNIRYPR